MTSVAVACTTDQHLLGEGMRWDARREELLWVDILAGHVLRGRVAADGGLSLVRTYELAGRWAQSRPWRTTTGGYWPPGVASSTCDRTARHAPSPRSPRKGRA